MIDAIEAERIAAELPIAPEHVPIHRLYCCAICETHVSPHRGCVSL